MARSFLLAGEQGLDEIAQPVEETGREVVGGRLAEHVRVPSGREDPGVGRA
ncbi:hypothetical protein D3C87_979600 [compost metagenome]